MNLHKQLFRSQKYFSPLLRNYGTDLQVWNEKRVVGYSCEQLFNVVSKVERYQEFIPYCKKSVVTFRKDASLSANLVIRFQPFFNISYTSHVTCIKPYLVTAVCKDMKLFEHLHTVWKFTPHKDNPNNTQVDFAVSFKFQNSYHSFIAALFIDDIVKKNMNAFLTQAEILYGKENKVKMKSEIIKQNKHSNNE
jgi:coenzyme Q-binding protein COQ10